MSSHEELLKIYCMLGSNETTVHPIKQIKSDKIELKKQHKENPHVKKPHVEEKPHIKKPHTKTKDLVQNMDQSKYLNQAIKSHEIFRIYEKRKIKKIINRIDRMIKIEKSLISMAILVISGFTIIRQHYLY